MIRCTFLRKHCPHLSFLGRPVPVKGGMGSWREHPFPLVAPGPCIIMDANSPEVVPWLGSLS